MVELGQHPAGPPQEPGRVAAAPEQRVRMPEVDVPDPEAVEHRDVLGSAFREECRRVARPALAQEGPRGPGVRRWRGRGEQRDDRDGRDLAPSRA